MAKKKNTNSPGDYSIGRGKPPRSSQFRPGQSGNPGGRRKNSLNLTTVIKSVLEGEIDLTENGRKRRVVILEAILLRQAQEALRGQPRAIDSLLDRYERLAGREIERPDEMPEEDLALLERVLGSTGRPRPAAAPMVDDEDEEEPRHD